MDWTATDRGKSAAQYKELCKQIENSKYGNDPKIVEILKDMSHTQTFSDHYVLIRRLITVIME